MHAGTSIQILGRVRSLHDSGRLEEAVEFLAEAVRARPGAPALRAALGRLLGEYWDPEAVPLSAVAPVLGDLLEEEAVGSRDLGAAVAAYLGAHSGLGRLAALEQPRELAEALGDAEAREALRDPVFRRALGLTVIPDLGLEDLLRRLREHLLLSVAGDGDDDPLLDDLELAGAIARHAFLMGYPHPPSSREAAALETLDGYLAEGALHGRRDAVRIAVRAAYHPLHRWARAPEVVELARRSGALPLALLVRQQVLAPAREAELERRIPIVSGLRSGTSTVVRDLYESHPYPRWTRASRSIPGTVGDYLRTQLTLPPPRAVEALVRPRILVAGCGTGLHPIQTAMAVTGARVTAMDLSRSSLAYAWRKAEELGLDGIRFVQGDLLALEEWGDRFDVVESVGVLQHLEDPAQGWRALIRLLRPGGLLKVGVYARRAREPVERLRERLEAPERIGGDDVVRALRERAVALVRRHPDLRAAARWRDFHSLHEFRDMVLHPAEHTFTLPGLAGIVREMGLEFLGFARLPSPVLGAFRSRHPGADALRDLSLWDAFEAEHPDSFRGLYQFWLRVPA